MPHSHMAALFPLVCSVSHADEAELFDISEQNEESQWFVQINDCETQINNTTHHNFDMWPSNAPSLSWSLNEQHGTFPEIR